MAGRRHGHRASDPSLYDKPLPSIPRKPLPQKRQPLLPQEHQASARPHIAFSWERDSDQTLHQLNKDCPTQDETKPFFHQTLALSPPPYDVRDCSPPPPRPLPQRPWRPFFLRRLVISCFAAVFVILALVTGVLYNVSVRNDGISSASSDYHYFWTYGPTALFLLLDAIWFQVDYAARAAMPWFAMAQPATATDSVLLDYVSKPPVVTLVESLRRRHFLVALANTIGMLLKLLSILATGFFVLNLNVPVTPQASLQLTNAFLPNNASATLMQPSPDLNELAGPFPYASLFSQKVLSMPPMAWASDDGSYVQSFAFQEADVGQNTTTASAVVDVFHADLGPCEPATAGLPLEFDENLVTFVQMNTSACDGISMMASGFPLQNQNNALLGQMSNFYCNDEAPDGVPIQMYNEKIGIFFGNYSLNLTNNHGSFTTNQATAFVCSPSYCIYQAEVAADSAGGVTITEPPTRDCRQLQGVNDINMTSLVLNTNSILSYSPVQQQLQWPSDPPTAGDLFTYVALKNQDMAIPSPGSLFDGPTLEKAFGAVYSTVAANIAAQSFTARGLLNVTPAEGTVMGTIASQEDRLVVNKVSFGLMMASLLVGVVLCIGLVFLIPQKTPCRTGSLGGVASVLSRSNVAALFTDHDLCPADNIRRICENYKFTSRAVLCDGGEKVWRLDCTPTGAFPPSLLEQPDRAKRSWWHPPGQSLYYEASLAVLLIVLIIVLEVVFRISTRNDGLANVNPQEAARFAWTYLPALLMTLTTLLVQGLNSAVRIVEPYSLLRMKNASGQESLLTDYTGQSALFSIPRALFRGRFAMLASTIGLCIGPVLTVAVGGLFSPQTVPYVSSVALTASQTFNFTGLDQLADSAPSVLPDSANASMFTFYELQNVDFAADAAQYRFSVPFLPFKQPQSQDPFFRDATTLSTVAPVLATDHGCGKFPVNGAETDANLSSVYINLEAPPECPPYVTGDNEAADPNRIVYLNDTLVPWNPVNYSTPFFGMTMWQMPDYTNTPLNYECPFMLGMYGSTDANQQVNSSELVVVACRVPLVGNTTMNITFALPGLGPLNVLQDDYQLDNNTIVNDQANITFVLESFLANTQEKPFDTTITAMLTAAQVTANATSSNSSALPLLLSQDVFLDTLTHVWDRAIYAYLTLSRTVDAADAANSADDTLAIPANWTGTFENPYRARLVQSAVSTRILQGVLSLILACVLVTYIALDRGDFLPMNPTSIAAKASLLAGSRLLRDGSIPPGAEWLSDRDLGKLGVFSTDAYALGWWDARRRSAVPAADPRFWRRSRSSDKLLSPGEKRPLQRYGIDAEE